MTVLGRTGADAMAIAIAHMCRVYLRYGTKLRNKIAQLEAEATLTTEQADQYRQFLDQLDINCRIIQLVADNSGF